MHATERQEALRRMVEETGTVTVSQVAEAWSVSEMTIRRDLKHLQAQGLVARVHGGAVAGSTLRWRARLDKHSADKARAADKLREFIPEQGCIYLDGSTTIFTLTEFLPTDADLTVVTNNIETFLRLESRVGIEAVLVGGTHNHDTDNFVGPLVRKCLQALSFDVAFFSAYALDADIGPSEPSIEDADVKSLVAERSARVCLAVSHDKLAKRATGVWSFPLEGSVLATDLSFHDDEEKLTPFRSCCEQLL